MQTQICCFPLPWSLHFLFAQKMKQKKALKSTYGSLDNHSLCRRLSMTLYEQENYFSHSYSLANCRFHSLRQYLGCDFFLWLRFTSSSVFSFVLLARKRSKALIYYLHVARSNIAKQKFKSLFFYFAFCILHFAFCILHF